MNLEFGIYIKDKTGLARSERRSCFVPGSSVHEISPDKNTGVGCHSLLQEIFPTQGSNLGLLHCRRILCRLGHQGSLHDRREGIK